MSDKDFIGKLRLKFNLDLSNGQWDEGCGTHKRFDWNMHLAGCCEWMSSKATEHLDQSSFSLAQRLKVQPPQPRHRHNSVPLDCACNKVHK